VTVCGERVGNVDGHPAALVLNLQGLAFLFERNQLRLRKIELGLDCLHGKPVAADHIGLAGQLVVDRRQSPRAPIEAQAQAAIFQRDPLLPLR
jgi:hypothetical protein